MYTCIPSNVSASFSRLPEVGTHVMQGCPEIGSVLLSSSNLLDLVVNMLLSIDGCSLEVSLTTMHRDRPRPVSIHVFVGVVRTSCSSIYYCCAPQKIISCIIRHHLVSIFLGQVPNKPTPVPHPVIVPDQPPIMWCLHTSSYPLPSSL